MRSRAADGFLVLAFCAVFESLGGTLCALLQSPVVVLWGELQSLVLKYAYRAQLSTVFSGRLEMPLGHVNVGNLA